MRLGVAAALVAGQLVPGDVEVAGGRIAGVGRAARRHGGIAVPGFVDLQVNGFAGIDFVDGSADEYAHAGEALLATGVTAYLPTFISAPEERLASALAAVPRGAPGPRILGAHLEGPFISAQRLGAHPGSARQDPDAALLERLLEVGPVRLVTLAPELPGALDLIGALRARGVAVACGHSDASAAVAHAAFDRGARSVTHLWNAMRPLSHREPGLVGAALTRSDVIVQLIVDGVHLADDTVRLVWQAAGGRVALVTDAMSGAGMGSGRFSLGGVHVVVADGIARRDDGVLAGSALTMIEAVRNLHALGAPLEQALHAASGVPARALDTAEVGRLEPGVRADVVVLDDALEIARVIVGGTTLFAR